MDIFISLSTLYTHSTLNMFVVLDPVFVIIYVFDSATGELYAKKLTNFVEKRLKNERAASVRTLTHLTICIYVLVAQI